VLQFHFFFNLHFFKNAGGNLYGRASIQQTLWGLVDQQRKKQENDVKTRILFWIALILTTGKINLVELVSHRKSKIKRSK